MVKDNLLYKDLKADLLLLRSEISKIIKQWICKRLALITILTSLYFKDFIH